MLQSGSNRRDRERELDTNAKPRTLHMPDRPDKADEVLLD
jgi:hypothetical protein